MGVARRATDKDATWARAWTADTAAELGDIPEPRRGDVAYATDTGLYYTWRDDGTWEATFTSTAFGRSLVDDADAATARATLELGTAATSNAGDFAAAAHTHTASEVTDFSTAADARITAATGVSVQAYSANLDEYAGVNPTAAGLALLDDATAGDQRTTLGLGSAATSAATDFAPASPVQTEAGISYSLDADDDGDYLRLTYAGVKAVILRPDSVEALPANAEYRVRNAASGDAYMTPGSGVTLNLPPSGTQVVPQNGTVWLKRAASDTFDMFGDTSAFSPQTESSSIYTAITTPPTDTRKLLIDLVVKNLKDAGVWSKLDGLWLTAAADSQAASINWVNPGTYDLTAVNSPTFTADRGYQGDGSTSYLDPGMLANGLTHYQQNDASIFAWNVLEMASSLTDHLIGASNSNITIRPRAGSSDVLASRVNGANLNGGTMATALGSVAGNRNGANAQQTYKDGVEANSGGGASVTPGAWDVWLLRAGGDYSGGLRISTAAIGASLTATQHQALHDATEAYLTGVGAI